MTVPLFISMILPQEADDETRKRKMKPGNKPLIKLPNILFLFVLFMILYAIIETKSGLPKGMNKLKSGCIPNILFYLIGTRFIFLGNIQENCGANNKQQL